MAAAVTPAAVTPGMSRMSARRGMVGRRRER